MHPDIRAVFAKRRPRVVFVLRDHIGGLLDAVPAFRAIRRAHPHAELTLLCNEVAFPVIASCPYLDKVRAFFSFSEEGELGRARRIRTAAGQASILAGLAWRTDLAIHFYPPVGGRLLKLMRRLGVRRQLGFEEDAHDELLTVNLGARDVYRRARESNAAVAEAVGAPCGDLAMEVWPGAEAVEKVHRLLQAEGRRKSEALVVFHPATHQMCNEWFIERWIELGRVLHERHGARILLTGSPSEELVGREIHRSLMGKVINLVGRTTLEEWIAAVSLAQLVVAPDAAITQVCQALRKPSICLMGTDHPVHHAPIAGEPMVQVQKWSGSFFPGSRDPHCGERGGVCHHPACRAPSGLAGIGVGDVLDGIERLQERTPLFGAARDHAARPGAPVPG